MQQPLNNSHENSAFSPYANFLQARKDNVNLWCASHYVITRESHPNGQMKRQ